MKRTAAAVLAAMTAFCFSCSGAADVPADGPLDVARAEELSETARRLATLLDAGDEDSALALADATVREALKGKTMDMWAGFTAASGRFLGCGDVTGFRLDGYDVIEMTLIFERSKLIQRTVFGSDNLIAGLFYRTGEVKLPPDGVREEAVTVDAGTGYPLDGLLSVPENAASVAVVLVHGSGPADMDSTVEPNKPFRDIAFALSAKGIAVLRYDKRTFAYASRINGDPALLSRLTVGDETIADAVAAVRLAKSRFSKVYILGHSMSGGLLARISLEGADADGYVIMAGTPRKLYEISALQNLQLAGELEAGGDEAGALAIRAMVAAETPKGLRLAEMTDEEALDPANTVFGMSAWYLRSFEGFDPVRLHMADKKPVLVLQGGRDRQVSDLDLWRTGLASHPSARFLFYPPLNHLMGEYTGEEVPFSQLVSREYAALTPVSADVTDDICDWIGSLSR